jgi:hypothetical protein
MGCALMCVQAHELHRAGGQAGRGEHTDIKEDVAQGPAGEGEGPPYDGLGLGLAGAGESPGAGDEDGPDGLGLLLPPPEMAATADLIIAAMMDVMSKESNTSLGRQSCSRINSTPPSWAVLSAALLPPDATDSAVCPVGTGMRTR